MARRPDTPCCGCGKLMWRGTGSRSPGQARCLPCRRAAPPRPKTERPARSCQHCHQPITIARRHRYCSDACWSVARHARGFGGTLPKSRTAARGYGHAHQKLRAKLLPLAIGTPCPLCDEVMDDADRLHLDHTPDRTGYRGIVHAHCNVADGARRGGQAARAKRLARGVE